MSVSRSPASTSRGASISGARASESNGCLRSSDTGTIGYCFLAMLRRLSKGETSMTARTGRFSASRTATPLPRLRPKATMRLGSTSLRAASRS